MRKVHFITIISLLLPFAVITTAHSVSLGFAWKTDTSKKAIELSELHSGGPPKDGIPALDDPRFETIVDAREWLRPKEPVLSLKVGDQAKAYPLQILIWHEIVNDIINGKPVAVTFCPLCYSAIVFERSIDGNVTTFGVSGFLRHSDMVMYDRRTESLWQQLTGEAIVGTYTGKTLPQLPAQIISFEQFREAYPNGAVLSRDTGYHRSYGRNPYVGYDSVLQKPFMFSGKTDDRLPPMEKIIVVDNGERIKAYPYRITKRKRVINDYVGSDKIVIFHALGAKSALDESIIFQSKESGSTGVFLPQVAGKRLTFEFETDAFRDIETASIWDITGRAVEGPLKGEQLEQMIHGDYFAFAWLAFRPQTHIYSE